MSEHPSATQTFVVMEASAVNALGVPVLGYALERGSAGQAAAPLELLCSPASRGQLLRAALSGGLRAVSAVWRTGREGASIRESTCLLYAQLHAEHMSKYCRQAGVAHIHAHFLGRAADVANALAKRLGCEWTVTAHASDIYSPKEPVLLTQRLAGTAAVACASRDVEASVKGRAAPFAIRTQVVRCGVDTETLQFPQARPPHAAPHVVTVGRLIATKGHWTVLQAATQLIAEDRSLHWTVAGDGPLKERLVHDARYTEASPQLTLTGALDHPATLDLMRGASVFVLPCEENAKGDSDGLPVALIEAMALGVPVVTTPVAGIPELVIPNRTGFLVEPKNAKQLADTLRHVLYQIDHSALDDIRSAARAKVEGEFDRFTEARELLDLLDPYLQRARA